MLSSSANVLRISVNVFKQELSKIRNSWKAENGNADALFNLGLCYANGKGLDPEDAVQAVEYYRQAAAKGHAEALCQLGFCYDTGKGVAPDAVQAVEFYRQAAAKGHTGALCLLGFCYDTGKGVAPDAVQAMEYYRQAAAKGYERTQYNLGACYANGKGVEPPELQVIPPDPNSHSIAAKSINPNVIIEDAEATSSPDDEILTEAILLDFERDLHLALEEPDNMRVAAITVTERIKNVLENRLIEIDSDNVGEIIATYVEFRKNNPEYSDKLPDFLGIDIDFEDAIKAVFRSETLSDHDHQRLDAIFAALRESQETRLVFRDITIIPEKLEALISGLKGSEVTELHLWRTNISNDEGEVDRLAKMLVGSKIIKIRGVIATPGLEEVLAANAAQSDNVAPAAVAPSDEHHQLDDDADDEKENGLEPALATESASNTDSNGSEETVNEAADIPAATAIDPRYPAAVVVAGQAPNPRAANIEIMAALARQQGLIQDLERRIESVEKDRERDYRNLENRQGGSDGSPRKGDEIHSEHVEELKARLSESYAQEIKLLSSSMFNLKYQLAQLKNQSGQEVEKLKEEIERQRVEQCRQMLDTFVKTHGQKDYEADIERLKKTIADAQELSNGNREAVDKLLAANGGKANIAVRELELLADSNPNVSDYMVTFQNKLRDMMNALFFARHGIGTGKDLFPWDLEEATSIKDMRSDALEVAKNTGVSALKALLEGFPFIAIGTKLLQVCYNAVKLRNANVDARKILGGIPNMDKLRELSQSLSVLMVEHHMKHSGLKKFFHKEKRGIAARIKGWFSGKDIVGSPAKELAQLDVIKMLRNVLNTNEQEININSIGTLMLEGVQEYSEDEKKKYRSIIALSETEVNNYDKAVAEKRDADAELAALYNSCSQSAPVASAAGTTALGTITLPIASPKTQVPHHVANQATVTQSSSAQVNMPYP
jgi:hypothetical protein